MGSFNLDILTDSAAILGFALSTSILLFGLFRNRENFTLDVIDYSDFGGLARFFVCIINYSHKPLVITTMSFDGAECELEPRTLRGEVGSPKSAETACFPISIPAREAQMVYIAFPRRQHTRLSSGTTVTFQIRTIRRRVQKSVLLGNTAHYLHSKDKG